MYQSLINSLAEDIIDFPANSPIIPSEVVGDGVNYSRAPLWQSPEGNFTGQMKVVAEWYIHLLWDGRNYIEYTPKGTVNSISDLPTSADYMDVWTVLNETVVKEPQYRDVLSYEISFAPGYYFDPDSDPSWVPVEFGHFVEDTANVPYPGYRIGRVITVVLKDVIVFWDGFAWSRPKHSNLYNDEPELHLPAGFLNFITPDVRLEYVSKRILTLKPVSGGTGFVLVNGQVIKGENSCCVYSTSPALTITESGAISPTYLQPSTGYYVYLANKKDSSFSVTALPETETYNATSATDFRGKLFLSTQVPNFGNFGSCVDAVVVGRIETTADIKAEGGPFFRHELDISWISRRASFQESYRDYSDFVLSYVGINELRLYCMDGHYGQMYIPEELIYLGNDIPVYADSPRIEIDDDEQPVLDETEISPNTEYFLYIINDVDAVNFNEINIETGRPWNRTDYGADENYDPDKDLRLKLILSTKSPEPELEFRNNIVPLTCGRMTESFPLFYSRYIGHVWTDAYGYFLYAKDISAIKTLALNPTHFRGQADFAIKPVDDEKFKIAEIEGTAGAIQVGGQTMFALPVDYDEVHEFDVNDYIQIYTEGNINSPLSDATQVVSNPETTFFIYLCNNDECWDTRANKLFASTTAPTRGYLSTNYPGTGARWIATIKTNLQGKLTGYWLLDSPGKQDAALLNLNDIANQLSNQTSELYDHDSQLDFHDQLLMEMLGVDSNYFEWLMSLSAAYSNAWEDLGDLSAEISNMGVDYDNINSLVMDMSADISDIYSDTFEISAGLDSLYSDLMAISAVTSNIGSDVGQLSIGLSMLDDNLSDLLSDIGDLGSVVEAIGNDVDSLFSHLGDASNVMSDIQSDINDISADISNISQDVINLQSDYGVISLLVSALDDATNELSDDVSLLGTDLDALSATISLVDSYVDDISAHFSLLVSDLYDVSAVMNSLDSDLLQLYSDMSYYPGEPWRVWSDLDELSFDLSLLHEEMGDVWSNVDTIELDIASLQSLLDVVDVQLGSLYSDYYDISDSISLLDDIVESLLSARDTMFADVDLLVCHLGELEQHYSNLVVDFAELELTLSGLDVDLTDLSFHVMELSDTYSNFQEDVASLSGTVDFIEAVFSNLVIDVGDLSETVISALSDFFDISENVTSLLSDMYDLSETWSNMREWVDSLESDLYAASLHLSETYDDLIAISGAFDGLLSGLADGFIGDFTLPTYDWVGKRFKFEDQKAAGLPIKVTWHSSNIVTLEPTEDDVQIVSPNACTLLIEGKAAIELSGLSENDTMYWLAMQGSAYGVTDHICRGSLFELSPATMVTGYSLGQVMSLEQSGASGGYAEITEIRDGILGSHELVEHGSYYQSGDEFTLIQSGINKTAILRVNGVEDVVKEPPTIKTGGSGYVVGDLVQVIQGAVSNFIVRVDSVVNNAVVSIAHVPDSGMSWLGNSISLKPKFKISGGGNNCYLQVERSTVDTVTFSIIAFGSGYSVGEVTLIPHEGNFYTEPDPLDPVRINITAVSGSGSISLVSKEEGGWGYTAANDIPSDAVTGDGSGAEFNILPSHIVPGAIKGTWPDGWVVTNNGRNYFTSESLLASADGTYHDGMLLNCHGSGATYKITDVYDGYVLGLGVNQGGSGYRQGVATTSGSLSVSIDCVWADSSKFFCTRDETQANRRVYSSLSTRKRNPSGDFDSIDIAYVVPSATNFVTGPWSIWSIYNDQLEELLSADGIGDSELELFGSSGILNILCPSKLVGFNFLRSHPKNTRFKIAAQGIEFKKALSFTRQPYTHNINYVFNTLFGTAYINSDAGPYLLGNVITTNSVELGVYGSSWKVVDLSGDFPLDPPNAFGYGSNASIVATIKTSPTTFTSIDTSIPRILDYTGGLIQTLNDDVLVQSIKTIDGVIDVDNAGAGGLMYMYRTIPERAIILKNALSKSGG